MTSSSVDDYYAILGLSRTATAEEIKRRFRKLARECHPDVAGNDPEAVERFTRIRRAYETLIDPEARDRYDNPPVRRSRTFYRRRWRPPGGFQFDGLHNGPSPGDTTSRPKSSVRDRFRDPGNNLDLEDIFSDFGGKRRPPPRPTSSSRRTASPPPRDDESPPDPGDDIQLKVRVGERIARMGGTVTVNYNRMKRGEQGTTLFRYNEIYDLRVPPGTPHGALLRVPRMGSAGVAGGPYGDLICDVDVVPERVRTAPPPRPPPGPPPRAKSVDEAAGGDGDERVVPISITEALLGGRIEVDTPKGRVRLSVPPGTSSDTRLRLRGRGKGGRDLYVRLQIVVPRTLDAESRQLIERFAELNPDSPRD
ncbi:MAG: DnaJ domain-containing protein [Myxococcota bacterium]